MAKQKASLIDIPIVGGLLKMQLERQLNRNKHKIEKWALSLAFEQLGLPNLADEESITRESFTKALNAGPLATVGIKLTNVFDKAAVRRDFEQLALATAAREFGINAKTLTVDGLKEALRDYVADKVAEQVGEGGGDLVNDAKELVMLVNIIKAVRKEYAEAHAQGLPAPPRPGRPPLKMDAASVDNRKRQAEYRRTHKRVWVPFGATVEQ
ncbi:hypothetical protein [Variovorax arabinosiphilus]|uniref:hypothetical protein n=1 Tax=Variovorax arabinosiphilus TaxID=3053498 RepID=UPI002579204F|nr:MULTISPECIES: hypothetical protein [unclassified Variovorax]MDM0119023.1 hypothetical protein [Variovorax sp. J2L1-78]MDM0129449.1 hypothetical protein [Variovorax sp. J2L1-63]MDM0232765.1 hypothetical protein [Variovorax sp. J2R1-6]